jgi:hypothetical protein
MDVLAGFCCWAGLIRAKNMGFLDSIHPKVKEGGRIFGFRGVMERGCHGFGGLERIFA